MYEHKNKRSCDRLISAKQILQLLKRGFTGVDIVSWAEEFGEAPVNHWISTKERLPESGRNVLIYYQPWEGDAVQVAILDRDRITFEICGEFNVGVGLVTHWMPLPEPPKDGDTQ